jgi:anaerobic selenocysteine-containing dehydrogenase
MRAEYQNCEQYTGAVVAPPEGSDVIAEWEFVYGLAQRMGLTLRISGTSLTPDSDGGFLLDMTTKPSADQLMEALVSGSRISLTEVKSHPSGSTFPYPAQIVQGKEDGWTGRFDLANVDMLTDLRKELSDDVRSEDSEFPFRMIPIRVQNQFNTTLNDPVTNRGRSYNPLFMNPADLQRLGLSPGDAVQITSDRASIPGIVDQEPDLLEGVVAMAFAYGGAPERDSEFRHIGSSPGRILNGSTIADPYVGMPRIGNIPVMIRLSE